MKISADTTLEASSIAQGLQHMDLRRHLFEIVHTPHRGNGGSHAQQYRAVWDAFEHMEMNGTCVLDRYSATCHTKRCGTYKREGECFNREHSWPKSWWGEDRHAKANKPQHSDLHHLFPADGYVNAKRGNHPLGMVLAGQEEYISTNGCKLGPCTCSAGECFKGTCFEPSDAYKGELARAYFYMSIRYMHEVDCCANDAVDRADIRAWMEGTLRVWHERHPPTERERVRNGEVERLQGNRNPFIDYPELARKIEDF